MAQDSGKTGQTEDIIEASIPRVNGFFMETWRMARTVDCSPSGCLVL